MVVTSGEAVLGTSRERAPWRGAVASERVAAGSGRFLKRQLSLPVSMISQ